MTKLPFSTYYFLAWVSVSSVTFLATDSGDARTTTDDVISSCGSPRRKRPPKMALTDLTHPDVTRGR